MKKIIMVVASTVLVLLLMVSLTPSIASAQSSTSGEIDYVLIQIKDERVVRIAIDEYVNLFLFKTEPLYGFLQDAEKNLFIYGVMSGEKYIDINEYVSAFITQGDPVNALSSAKEMPATISSQFFKIKLGSIESGNIQLEPIVETIEVFQVIDIY